MTMASKLSAHKLGAAVAGFAFAALAAPASAGNVLLNGNFGTGDLSDWAPFVTSGGTTGSGLPAVSVFDTTGAGPSNSAEFDVGDASFASLFTRQGGGLTQAFNLAHAGTATFSAALASQDDASGQVNVDAGTYTILIDGTPEASTSLGSFSTPFQVVRGSLDGSVALGAGAHTFSIEITRKYLATGDTSPTEYVTNLELASSPSPVPEPEKAAFELAGLVFVGANMAWRRRRA